MCRSAGGEPIRGLSEGLQIPWWKSRDMTSWSCGGDLGWWWNGGPVTWDEHDRSSGSRGSRDLNPGRGLVNIRQTAGRLKMDIVLSTYTTNIDLCTRKILKIYSFGV